LPEPALCPPPPRAELLRLLRGRLSEPWPALRIVAEDVLAAETAIDWVAADAQGGAVAVLVGEAGGDLELVARALAHRAWLEPRLRGWIQLAPAGGLRPEAGVRALLLCPAFRAEAVAAATAGAVALAVYRCLRDGAGLHAVIEPLGGAAPVESHEAGVAAPEPFRTHLTDLDLGLGAPGPPELGRLASPLGAQR